MWAVDEMKFLAAAKPPVSAEVLGLTSMLVKVKVLNQNAIDLLLPGHLGSSPYGHIFDKGRRIFCKENQNDFERLPRRLLPGSREGLEQSHDVLWNHVDSSVTSLLQIRIPDPPERAATGILGSARESRNSPPQRAECLPAKGSKRLAKALTEVYKEHR